MRRAIAPAADMPGPVFDAHLHVIDPRFPLVGDYVPEAFGAADYLARAAGLGIVGGSVVSGSFHGFDQTYLLDALSRLGPSYVGVTQLPIDVTDAELRRLDACRVRAVRVNLLRGGSAPIADLDRLARRVWDTVGWHTELYVDGADLAALEPQLAALPRLSIDHLGMTAAGTTALLRLAAGGAKVKATGFGRVDLDVAATLRAVHDVDPHALMAGTDLPSTRARRPFASSDLDLVADVLGDDAHLALHDNAATFYGR